MGMPAARVTDMHVCPMVTGIVPHVGGPILPPCAPTVLTGKLFQARIGDMLTCVGPPDVIAMGAFTVLTEKKPSARLGDMTVHGGSIVLGCFTVLIGDAGGGGGGGGGSVDPLKMDQIDILNARAAALQMLEVAIQNLERGDPETKAKLDKWFGASDDATSAKMLARAKAVKAKLAGMKPENFVKAKPGHEKVFGYVYPKDDTKMYLGNAFKTAPLTGEDSKAGTMIHETSHYDSVAGTRDEKLADGTQAYGHKNSQKLVKEDPGKAQNNADSFEYFVEDQ